MTGHSVLCLFAVWRASRTDRASAKKATLLEVAVLRSAWAAPVLMASVSAFGYVGGVQAGRSFLRLLLDALSRLLHHHFQLHLEQSRRSVAYASPVCLRVASCCGGVP